MNTRKKTLFAIFSVFLVAGFVDASQPAINDPLDTQNISDFYTESQCVDGDTVYKNYHYYVGDNFNAIDYLYNDTPNTHAYTMEDSSRVFVIDPFNVANFDNSFTYASNGKPLGVEKVYFTKNSGIVQNGTLAQTLPVNPRFQVVYNMHRQWYYHQNHSSLSIGPVSIDVAYRQYPNGYNNPLTDSNGGLYKKSDNISSGYECFNYYVHYCGDGVVDTASSIAALDGGISGSVANEQCDEGANNGQPGSGCSATCQKETPQKFDLALKKTVKNKKNTYNLGDTVTYDITVYNQGDVDATNVEVVDYIPSGMELADTTWTLNGNKATKTISSLEAGQSTTLTISLTIKDPAPRGANYRNAAEISGADGGTDCDSTPDNTDGNQDGETTDTGLVYDDIGSQCSDDGDGDDEDDHDIADIDIKKEVDLAIDKNIDTQTVVDGQTVTFTINFINQGDVTADVVDVVDTLPQGYHLQSVNLTNYTGAPANPQPTITSGSNGSTTIMYSNLTLAPNQGGTITVVATVDDDFCADMTNTVRIFLNPKSSSLTETNLTNNNDQAVAYCESDVDLDKTQKTKDMADYTDDTLTVEAGDTLQYKVVVGHKGAKSGILKLVDDLPPEVENIQNIVFTVAGVDKSDLCAYDATTHQITCEPFELDKNEKAVLTFDTTVKSDVKESDVIINKVTLYEDGKEVDEDDVDAVPEDDIPDGDITKTVRKDKLEIGEQTTFDVVFKNTGEVPLVKYVIKDTWPAHHLALVCGDVLYSTYADHSDNMSALTACLQENLQITHSANGLLSNDNIGISAAWNGDSIVMTLTFDTANDALHLLNPQQSVSFSLTAEAFVEKDNITNYVDVNYRDADGDGGDDEDDVPVDVEGGHGTCEDIASTSLVYTSQPESYKSTYTCKANDTAQKITLDCGNGQAPIVGTNTDSVSGECIFTDDTRDYDVTCLFNDETVPTSQCTESVGIKFPEDPKPPICGDGIKDYYEQCDYNQKDSDGKTLLEKGECTRQCTVPSKPNDPEPKIPSCLYVETAQNGGNNKAIPMSIMKDEVLPFRWALDNKDDTIVDSCESESSAGKIVGNTMMCTFTIRNHKRELPGEITVPCNEVTKTYSNLENLPQFEKDGQFNQQLKNILNLDVNSDKGLGEYELKLARFTYSICEKGDDGTMQQSEPISSEDCCLVNFTVTKPYIIQEGLGAGKDLNKTIYGSFSSTPWSLYYRLNGKTFAEDDVPYTSIDESSYNGGQAVDTAVNEFADKYSALAVGNGNVKKVPGKNIFILSSGTLDATDVSKQLMGQPFTMIVDGGAVEINESLTKSAMYVVKKGKINIGKNVNEVSGIFVLANSDATITSPKIRNTDTDYDWNKYGQLVINGVIVGGDDSVANLAKARRSVIEGWFQSNVDKREMMMKGASLRIKNDPQLWITPPPGVDELDSVFEIYKQ